MPEFDDEAGPDFDHADFPIVAYGEAGVTVDGQAVMVQLFTVDGAPIRFNLRGNDLEKFVTLFLRMAASVNAGDKSTAEDRVQYQPIPISGVSAGELADGNGCLGVMIGGTELMFQVPLTQLSQFAESLLTVGVSSDRRRMS